MITELQPLLDLLTTHFPWLPAALKIFGSLIVLGRFTVKPFSRKIRERMTQGLVEIATDGTPAERDGVLNLLHAYWYRSVVFWVDAITSLKFPTHIEFHRLVAIAEERRKVTTP